MALIAKRKNSSQPHHRASDQQMHAALSLHSSSKACHGMPRASDWARRRRVARSSVAGDKATGAGAAGDGTMGGPGGRTRDGASDPAIGQGRSKQVARRAVEAPPPRRGGVTKPCFLYSDNHRGAQIWIRCGSSRGQSSKNRFLLKKVASIGGPGILQ